MKALKGSLIALVAIMAAGLTVAMQAGAFENKTARAGECYFDATIGDLSNSCTEVILDETDLCTAAVVGDAVKALGASFTTNPEGLCQGGAQFCCLEIQSNTTAICNQDQIDPAGTPGSAFYRVLEVHCQE